MWGKKKYAISIVKGANHKIEEITNFCGHIGIAKSMNGSVEFRWGMYPGNFQKLQMSAFLGVQNEIEQLIAPIL